MGMAKTFSQFAGASSEKLMALSAVGRGAPRLPAAGHSPTYDTTPSESRCHDEYGHSPGCPTNLFTSLPPVIPAQAGTHLLPPSPLHLLGPRLRGGNSGKGRPRHTRPGPDPGPLDPPETPAQGRGVAKPRRRAAPVRGAYAAPLGPRSPLPPGGRVCGISSRTTTGVSAP